MYAGDSKVIDRGTGSFNKAWFLGELGVKDGVAGSSGHRSERWIRSQNSSNRQVEHQTGWSLFHCQPHRPSPHPLLLIFNSTLKTGILAWHSNRGLGGTSSRADIPVNPAREHHRLPPTVMPLILAQACPPGPFTSTNSYCGEQNLLLWPEMV